MQATRRSRVPSQRPANLCSCSLPETAWGLPTGVSMPPRMCYHNPADRGALASASLMLRLAGSKLKVSPIFPLADAVASVLRKAHPLPSHMLVAPYSLAFQSCRRRYRVHI